MVILKWRLTGGFWMEDQNGNKLGRITQKFFGPKYILKNLQDDILGYADIRARKPQKPDSTDLEKTQYVLTSALNKEQLAIGFPAYNESVDVSLFKALYLKPPLADRMKLHLQGVDEELFLRLKMNGSATISGIDKNICGHIQRLRIGAFSVDLQNLDDPVLLCGVFLFTRYLLKENESLNIV